MTVTDWSSNVEVGKNVGMILVLFLGLLLYSVLLVRHLLRWKRPYMNVAYLRTVMLAVVYLTVAFVSFMDTRTYEWLAVLRSWYEAYIFLVVSSMLVAAYGGEEATELLWASQATDRGVSKWVPSPPFGWTRSQYVHRALLQFQVVKPLTGVIFIALDETGRGNRVVTVVLRLAGVLSLVLALRTLLQVYSTVSPRVPNLRAKSKVIWFKSLVTSVVLEEAIFSILASFDVFHFSEMYSESDVEVRLLCAVVAVQSLLWLVVGCSLFVPADSAVYTHLLGAGADDHGIGADAEFNAGGRESRCSSLLSIFAFWTAYGVWSEDAAGGPQAEAYVLI